MAIVRVKNTFNTSQIDERYTSLGMTYSGTVTLTTDPAAHPNPMLIGSVTVPGTFPQIALASTIPINVNYVAQSGGNWTFHLRAQAWSAPAVSYWIFDHAAQVPVPTTGARLIVRNPSTGGVVFHSGMKPLRLIESIQMVTPEEGWDTVNGSAAYRFQDHRTVASGRAYAVIQGSMCYRFESYADTSGELLLLPTNGGTIFNNYSLYGASVVNGNEIDAGLFQFENFQNEQPTSTPNMGQTHGNLTFWIVDVTNYGGAIPSADTLPAAVNWANMSISTTSNTGSTSNATQTISGIDTPITIRATPSSYSGNLTNGILRMFVNGVVVDTMSWTGAGSLDATVTNGQTVHFDLDANTATGARSGSATVTVRNLTEQNMVMDTFTIAATVDSDNNYNLAADFTPNNVNWNDINSNSPGAGQATDVTNSQTISGIDDTITLHIVCTGAYISGSATNAFTGSFLFYPVVNEVSQESLFVSAGQGTVSQTIIISAPVNSVIYFVAQTTAGDQLDGASSATGGVSVSVRNASQSNTVLDTFTVTQSTDSPGGGGF